jgi:transposase
VGRVKDPELLANLARRRLLTKLPALRQALAGCFRAHHAFLISHLLVHVDYLEEALATLSERIAELMGTFTDAVDRLDTIRGIDRRTGGGHHRGGRDRVPGRVENRNGAFFR